jgi:spermidine synthase
MKTIISETAAHIPLCVVENPKAVLLLGEAIDKSLSDQISKHGAAIAIRSFDSGLNAAASSNERFDAIVDLRTRKPDADEAKALLAKLTENGVLLKAFASLEAEQLKAYESCRFVVPCALSAFAPLDGAISGFVFASKKLHPTADLKLQKADMLEDLGYYSTETHNAAFALPPFILAKFDELIKN